MRESRPFPRMMTQDLVDKKEKKKKIKAILETTMVVTKSSSYESYKIEDHTIKRGYKRGSTGPSC